MNILIFLVVAVGSYYAMSIVQTEKLLGGVFFTFRWHLYRHEHYHLIDTPLERFAWFRMKRRLHFVHHRDARYNFAVVEFWIDNFMGTRRKR